ncbi:unnamed protein product [Adineta steineri]|uniref:Uncharacterized protein n=1 Tax=Adineta steineri TaxID=433720 RepID=A0A813S1Z3_9BILA|nr:unnamed protein product [Adineta steineri]
MSNNNDISAKLRFFGHTVDGSAPWIDSSYTRTLTEPIMNFIPALTDVIIHNMRGQENTFDLDTHGFEVHKYNGQANNEFDNDLKNDIHLTDLRGSNITYSIYTISHNAQNTQKWYYLNEMRSDELLVFKMFDSDPNVAQFCAHTGFINDHVPMNDIQQISLEARCFVFYDQ